MVFFMRMYLLSIFFIFLLLFHPDQALGHASVTQEEVWNAIHETNPPLLIDTRSFTAYSNGHIPTAISITHTGDPISQSELDFIQSIDYDLIITYCSCVDGINALAMANRLESAELSPITYMIDDFLYWPYDQVNGSEPGFLSYDSSNDSPSLDTSIPNIDYPLLLINSFGIISVIIVIIKKKH